MGIADTRREMAALIGTLGELASYKDLDASLLVMRQMASVMRIDPKDIPEIAQISEIVGY